MATRYQNGLLLNDPSAYVEDYVGATFSRWLYEFLVHVVGWTSVDTVGSKWTNYIGSGGAGTAVVSDAETLVITSPSYAFSTSDVGKFLTLTGFTTGVKDGIYRILKYVNSAGSDYTVKIDKRMGPDDAGLPSSESSSWKLWDGTVTYNPDTGNKFVVAGTGVTGAGTVTGNGIGDSISMAGSVATLTDSGANFQTSDVGKSITVSGATNPGNNGTFTIVSRISTTQITYTNASGVNETSGFAWQISYIYHLYVEVDTSSFSRYPKVSVSPFASWNPGTHSWGDSKYTVARNPESEVDHSECVVYAEASEQHIHVWIRSRHRQSSPGQPDWYVYLIEEIDSFFPEIDPRPIVCLAGHSEYNEPILVGFGLRVDDSIWDGTRGLAYNDTTTLTYYPSVPTTRVQEGGNLIYPSRKRFSMWSKKQYKIKLILESRTSGYMEYRGTFRNAWLTSHITQTMATLKLGSDYYRSPYGGWLMRSNGSRNWYPFVDTTPYGV